MEGRGRVGIVPPTAGDGVREVVGAVLLGADVADTARIKGEHCRLWEREEGGRGGAAESLSLSQKKDDEELGLVRKEEIFSVLIPLPLLRTTKGFPFGKG